MTTWRDGEMNITEWKEEEKKNFKKQQRQQQQRRSETQTNGNW